MKQLYREILRLREAGLDDDEIKEITGCKDIDIIRALIEWVKEHEKVKR